MGKAITYGAAFADVYDEWYGASDDLAAVVAMMCEHGPRRVLELGVGTGRIALAVAAAVAPYGGKVIGLDESPEMLTLLAAKDPFETVTRILGDMVDEQPEDAFDLIVCSYNTFFNVSNPLRQAQCLSHIAARLSPTGLFFIDGCIIDSASPIFGTATERRGAWQLLTTSTFIADSGIINGLTVSTHDDGRRVERPWCIAYQSPASLDIACTHAGLQLSNRYSSWHKTPFDTDSQRHVSIYRNLR